MATSDNLRKLHDNLSKRDGFSVPYEQFEKDMSNEENLKKLHDNLSKRDGFSVPYDRFKVDMFGGNQEAIPQSTPTQQAIPQAQPVQQAEKPKDSVGVLDYLGAGNPAGFANLLGKSIVHDATRKKLTDQQKEGILETVSDTQNEIEQKRQGILEQKKQTQNSKPWGSNIAMGFAPAGTEAIQFARASKEGQDLANYTDAADELKKVEKRIKVGDTNGLSTLLQGAVQPLAKDFFTAGLNEIGRSLNEVGIAVKMRNGEKLSDSEQALLESYNFLQQVQNNTDMPLSADVTNALSEMVPYMVQFAATGSTGTAAKLGTKKLLGMAEKGAFKKVLLNAAREGGEKALAKKATEIGVKNAAKNVAAYTTGAAAQAAVMPMGIKNVSDRMIGTFEEDAEGNFLQTQDSYESFPEALGKGYLNTFAEVFGEGAMTGLVKNGAKGIGRTLGANVNKIDDFFKSIENIPIAKKAGVGNVLEEFGEEHITALIQNTVEGDWKSFYTLENQLILGFSVLGMQGAFSAAKGVGKLHKGIQEDRYVSAATKNFNALPDEVKEAAAIYVNSDNPTKVAEGLSSLYNEGIIKQEHKEPILDYVMARALRESRKEFNDTRSLHEHVINNVKTNLEQQYLPFVNQKEDKLTQAIYTSEEGDIPVFITDQADENTFVIKGLDGAPKMVPKALVQIQGEVKYSNFIDDNIAESIRAVDTEREREESDVMQAEEQAQQVIGQEIEYQGKVFTIRESNADGMTIVEKTDDNMGDVVQIPIDQVNQLLGSEIQTEQTKQAKKEAPVTIQLQDKEYQALPTDGGYIIDYETTDASEAKTIKAKLEKQFENKFTVEVSETPIDGSLNVNHNFHLRPIQQNGQDIQGQQAQAPIVQQEANQASQEVVPKGEQKREYTRVSESGKVIPLTVSAIAGITPETENPIKAYKALKEKLLSYKDITTEEKKFVGEIDTIVNYLEEQQGIVSKSKQNLKDKGFEVGRMDDSNVDFYQNETPETMAIDIIQNLGSKDSIYKHTDFPIFRNNGQLGIIQENIKQHKEKGVELLPDAKKAVDFFTQSIKERRVSTTTGQQFEVAQLELEVITKRILADSADYFASVDELLGDVLPDNIEKMTKFIDNLTEDEIINIYNNGRLQKQKRESGLRSTPDTTKDSKSGAKPKRSGSEPRTDEGQNGQEKLNPKDAKKKKAVNTGIIKRLNRLVQNLINEGGPRNFEEEILILLANKYFRLSRVQFINLTGLKGVDLRTFFWILKNNGAAFDTVQEYFEYDSNKIPDDAMDIPNRVVDLLTTYYKPSLIADRIEDILKSQTNPREIEGFEELTPEENKEIETVVANVEKIELDDYSWINNEAGDLGFEELDEFNAFENKEDDRQEGISQEENQERDKGDGQESGNEGNRDGQTPTKKIGQPNEVKSLFDQMGVEKEVETPEEIRIREKLEKLTPEQLFASKKAIEAIDKLIKSKLAEIKRAKAEIKSTKKEADAKRLNGEDLVRANDIINRIQRELSRLQSDYIKLLTNKEKAIDNAIAGSKAQLGMFDAPVDEKPVNNLKKLDDYNGKIFTDKDGNYTSIEVKVTPDGTGAYLTLTDKSGKVIPRPMWINAKDLQENINTGYFVEKEAPKQEKNYGTDNKIVSNDRYEELKKKMLGKRNNLNSGIDPEMMAMGAEMAVYHFEAGARKFTDFSKRMISDLGDWISPYLKSFYEMARYMPQAEAYSEKLDSQDVVKQVNISNLVKDINVELKKEQDVLDRPNNGKQDSPDTNNEVQGYQENVPNDGTGSGKEGNGTSQDGTKGNKQRKRSKSSFDDTPTLFGKQGDNPIYKPSEQPAIEVDDAGDIDGRGRSIDSPEGNNDNDQGRGNADSNAVEQVSGNFAQRVRENLKRQKAAEGIPVKLQDADNIRETLPFLLPEQQDDVIKAEKRFYSDEHKKKELANGKGVLFTNGTGTGKTYTGLGIAKRFTKLGKTNILIITPSQPKVNDWSEDAKNLGLKLTPLSGTKDAGQGAVITTFANFRENEALKERDFDLIIYDESHRIMEAKGGKMSSTTYSHYEHANITEYQALNRIKSVHPLWIKEKELNDAIRNVSNRPLDMMQEMYQDLVEKEEKFAEELKALKEKQKEALPKLEERAKKAHENTKVVFLSATPFKEHFNLKYANGALFNWGSETTYEGHSRVDAESRFFLDNFGSAYEWKYHRLQQKSDRDDNAVAMQEVEFSKKLMAQGVMSGRAIESDKDYERVFPKVSGGFNSDLINKAYSDIYNYETKEYELLRNAAREMFHSYNYTTQLLEAFKTSVAIPRIKKHLDLGRKVVVFHRRQKSEVTPPFATIIGVTRMNANEILKNTESAAEEKEKAKHALQQASKFESKYSDLLEYEATLNYNSAVTQISQEFGDRAVYVNGNVTSKIIKSKNIKDFNTDGSGIDIIVVQEDAGKEGISLHDTSGKHQRVLMSMSMPISSTTALQIEGRTFRIGNESDAIFEYPLIGLDLEILHFAQNINKKLSTTENLAVGEQARDLLRSFSEGVLFNSTDADPNLEQGKGGKEYDKKEKQTFSEFQRAIMVYNTNNKKRGKRDEREGLDYYATPEPIGQKIVQWANLKEFDSFMEPSGGHGAIAMWVPNNVNLTAIEPSTSLFSKLAARAGGGKQKLIPTIFEDYNIINKYNSIGMNPPFGQGGSLAIKHVRKAFQHLKEGGRIVAVIPNGGSMDKHLNKFFDEVDDKDRLVNANAVLRGEVIMPGVMFEQAGTKVGTRIVIIDKISDQETRENLQPTSRYDLSQYDKIKDLFEAIEYIDMPSKVKLNTEAVQNNQATEVKPVQDEVITSEDRLNPVKEYKHTQTGEILHNVQMKYRLDKEDYYKIADIAKKHNPFNSKHPFSKYSEGFLFRSKEDAIRFKNEVDKNEAKFKKSIADQITDKTDPVEVINTIHANVASNVTVEFVDTVNDLPKNIKESKDFDANVEAVTVGNKVYFVKSKLKNKNQAIAAWIHEVGLHVGIKNLIPNTKERNEFHSFVWRNAKRLGENNPKVRAIVEMVQKDYGNDPILLGEEFLANYADRMLNEKDIQPAERSFWKSILTKFRELLDRVFKFDSKTELTEKDLHDIVTAAVQSNYNPDNFYSTVERALQAIQVDKATPDQWKAQLEKNGAKQAELDWMGWDGFVASQGIDGLIRKTIAKKAIQEWIDGNRIEIQEVVKGDYSNRDLEIVKVKPFIYNVIDSKTNEVLLEGVSQSKAGDFIDNAWNGTHTKFSQYQIPGGENYKELLLTRPVKGNTISASEKDELETLQRRMNNEIDFPQKDLDRYKVLMQKGRDSFDNKDQFKSSHWDETNVLAHTRISEHKDTNGNRVLFVEELQSDWQQKGKKEGFKYDEGWDLKEIKNLPNGQFQPIFNNGEMLASFDTLEAAKSRAEGYSNSRKKSSVPDMPFKQTPQWVNLVLRRMMKYAADNGFNSIAWTPGDVQADRYSLAQQVSMVSAVKNKNGGYNLVIEDLHGLELPDYRGGGKNVTAEDMENHVGKEYAKALIEGADKNFGKPWPKSSSVNPEFHTIRTKDFKIGGEGMKAFYDQIIPVQAKKVGKPFNSSVTPIEIVLKPNSFEKAGEQSINMETGEVEQGVKNNGETMKVLSLPVTKGMSVSMPMFRKAEGIDYTDKNTYLSSINSLRDEANTLQDTGGDSELGGRTNNELKETTFKGSVFTESGYKYWVQKESEQGYYQTFRKSTEYLNAEKEHISDDKYYQAKTRKYFRDKIYPYSFNNSIDKKVIIQAFNSLLDQQQVSDIPNVNEYIDKVLENISTADLKYYNRESAKKLLLKAFDKVIEDNPIRFKKTESTNPITLDNEKKAQELREKEKEAKVMSKKDRIGQFLFDNKKALKNFQEKIIKLGGKIADNTDAYIAESLSHSRVLQRQEKAHDTLYIPLVKTIAKLAKKTDSSFKDIANYLVAKHSIERNQYFINKEVETLREKLISENADPVEITLMTDGLRERLMGEYENDTYSKAGVIKSLADEGIRWMEGKTTLQERMELHKQVQALSDQHLDYMLEYQIISRETYDKIKKMYNFYVPLRGWDATAETELVYRDASGEAFAPSNKIAEGRKSFADDPVSTLMNMMSSLIVEGEKNNIKLRAKWFLQANKAILKGQASFRTSFKVYARTTEGKLEEVPDGEYFAKIDIPEEYKDETKYKIGINIDTTTKGLKTAKKEKDHEVMVYEGGDLYILQFNDPEVALALNNKDFSKGLETATQAANRTVGKVTRYLSAMVTSRNPAFMAVNMKRDYGSSSIFHYVSGGAKQWALFQKNYVKIQKALLLGSDLNSSNEIRRAYALYKDFGGQTGLVNIKDVDSIKKEIENDFKRFQGNVKANAWHMAGVPFRGLEKMAAWSENMARFATFMTALEMGKTHTQAAWMAKQASINFNKKGRVSGIAGSLYAFFNASMQAANLYGTLWGENSKRMAFVHMLIISKSAVAAILAQSLFGGDDDDELLGDKVSPYTKYTNWILPIGDEDTFLKNPQAQGYRVWEALGTMTAEIYLLSNKLDGMKLTEAEKKVKLNKAIGDKMRYFIGSIPKDFSPIDANGFITKEGYPSYLPMVPSAFKPLAELGANKNFMDNPIYGESYGDSKAHSQRYFNSVNKAIVDYTDKWFELFGGDTETKDKIVRDEQGRTVYKKDGTVKTIPVVADINPEWIEHLISGYLGGFGTFSNQVIGMVASIVRDEEVLKENMPIVSRFIGTANYSTVKDNYYTKKADAQTIRNGYNDSLKKGTVTDQEIEAYNKAILFNKYDKQIKYNRDLLKTGINGKSLTDKQKENVEKEILGLMEKASKVME